MSAQIVTDQNLIDSIHAAERRHSDQLAQGGTPRERIAASLAASSFAADIGEFHCGMKTEWEKLLLVALLKRYGVRPYRYRKQRKSTVLVRLSKGFMDSVLWPIFNDVSIVLQQRFTQLTATLVSEIAPPPYSMEVHDHEQGAGELCDACRQKHQEQAEHVPGNRS